MAMPRHLMRVFALIFVCAAAAQLQAAKPRTIVDRDTGTKYAVDDNLTRISSYHKNGKALWHLDVEKVTRIADPAGKVTVTSLGRPTMAMVTEAGKREMRYLLVRFSTGEFGLVSKLTARYTFLGPK